MSQERSEIIFAPSIVGMPDITIREPEDLVNAKIGISEQYIGKVWGVEGVERYRAAKIKANNSFDVPLEAEQIASQEAEAHKKWVSDMNA